MKYVIMCGANTYPEGLSRPRQLVMVNGEILLRRTVALLESCGVVPSDIWITLSRTEDINVFSEYVDPKMTKVDFIFDPDTTGLWVNCFTRHFGDESVTYIFGDVYFSQSAIHAIVDHSRKDGDPVEFFASSEPPCGKQWNEPFAFVVRDPAFFFNAVEETKRLYKLGYLKRCISWELWQVIKGTPYNHPDYTNYIAINDYTCDIDDADDIKKIEATTYGMHIMIHAVPKRMWYVEGYLVPSLEKQGFYNITVMCDKKGIGNLFACLWSFGTLPNYGFTIHLQDDVVISKRFYIPPVFNSIENSSIYCGFASKYDDGPVGYVSVKDMWLSFPCIGMSNYIAKGFVTWVMGLAKNDPAYSSKIEEGKYDDWLFKEYMKKCHANITVRNVEPNLVEHIDYLIGGTTCNQARKDQIVKSVYWNEDDIVEDLKRWIDSEEYTK